MLVKDELLRFFASGCFPHKGRAAPSHSDGRSAEQRIVPLQLLAMLGLYNITEDVLLWCTANPRLHGNRAAPACDIRSHREQAALASMWFPSS